MLLALFYAWLLQLEGYPNPGGRHPPLLDENFFPIRPNMRAFRRSSTSHHFASLSKQTQGHSSWGARATQILSILRAATDKAVKATPTGIHGMRCLAPVIASAL